MGVKILILFDGMACGMIAMKLAGVEVESYDAYFENHADAVKFGAVKADIYRWEAAAG